MKMLSRIGMVGMAVILLLLSLAVGCGDDDDELVPLAEPTVEQQSTLAPSEHMEEAVIKIGNHTDKTGPGTNAMQYVNMALADTIEYYNENNLIPGVEVELIEYDGQADPSKDLPGYEWLKQRGADLITTWYPAVAMTLKSHVEEDGIPLFAGIVRKEILSPPEHLFITSTLLDDTGWTMIKWVAENHWDYQTNGPAKIGGACWDVDDGSVIFDAIERYAELHPEQMEWVSGHITTVGSFTWSAEVEALKNCDYIWLPFLPGAFIREYYQAGHKTATFLGSDAQLTFLGMIRDMDLFDELDGSLFLMINEWWNEEGEFPDMINQLVRDKHPDSYETIIQAGKGYMAVMNSVFIIEIIKSAADAVGPENLDSAAIYEAAQSATLMLDGVQRLSYSETKRTSPDRVAVFEVRGADEDIFRITDWFPVDTPP